eukprot:4162708-Prymnesium_polylepis.1
MEAQSNSKLVGTRSPNGPQKIGVSPPIVGRDRHSAVRREHTALPPSRRLPSDCRASERRTSQRAVSSPCLHKAFESTYPAAPGRLEALRDGSRCEPRYAHTPRTHLPARPCQRTIRNSTAEFHSPRDATRRVTSEWCLVREASRRSVRTRNT